MAKKRYERFVTSMVDGTAKNFTRILLEILLLLDNLKKKKNSIKNSYQ